MELLEVIGRRRSIRYLKPYKPVEKEKIQIMFEAARIASHWGNVQSLRGIALFKDEDADKIDIMQGAIIGWQFKVAPVVIVWYLDTSAVDGQSDRLMGLAEVGALGVGDKFDGYEIRSIKVTGKGEGTVASVTILNRGRETIIQLKRKP